MSHIGQGDPKHDVCTRALSRPPKMLKYLVCMNNKQLSDLSIEGFCAAHLVSGIKIDDDSLWPINQCVYLIHIHLYTQATSCQSALDQYSLDPKLGITFNYRDLPGSLIGTVFPSHFGIPVGPTEEERINDICSMYSKGGHKITFNKE